MQYETLTDFELTGSTSLRGHVRATYQELCAAFGKPLEGDGYKTQVEWVILLTDEEENQFVATIYDWKIGEAYVGTDEGILPEENESWNIGGHKPDVVRLIDRILVETREMLAHEEECRMYQWDFEWEQSGRADLN